MEPLYVVVGLMGTWLLSLGAAWWAGRSTMDDRCELRTHQRDVALAEVERLRAQGAAARTADELVLEAARRHADAAVAGGPRGLRLLLGRPAAGPVGADPAGGEAGGSGGGDRGSAGAELGPGDEAVDRA